MDGTGIDRDAIARFMGDLQEEFDKYPIRMPVSADQSEFGPRTTVYNGPVILGNADGARLAWNSHAINQSNNELQPITAGMESLAQAVIDVMERLPEIGLDAEDEAFANEAGVNILAEVTQTTPDVGKIKRALTLMKGALARVAVATQTGVDAEVAEWAQHSIAHLGSFL